jgi:predicted permease
VSTHPLDSLDDDIRDHLDREIQRNIDRGMSPEAARDSARRAFGSVMRAKEDARAVWIPLWMDQLGQDIRYACRTLRKSPRFSVVAVAMLALATGLNVTVFTIRDAMLFRGYPLAKRNDRLVYVQVRRPVGRWGVPYVDFEAWRTQAQTFEGLAFVASLPISLRDRDGRPLDMDAPSISANTFGLLGVAPTLGRDFAAADEAPGAAAVAILNHRFWADRYGKRADIVGSTVQINGAPATIIGVMPEGFDFPSQQNLWTSLTASSDLRTQGFEGFVAVGRLRNGATLGEARAALETINRRLEAADPASDRRVVPSVLTYSQFRIGPDAPAIYGSLWAAGWFVFLIASANLTSLTLSRTIGRVREFSTRVALGAGQWRLTRQILLENLILAGVAGVLGWWMTTWSVGAWARATQSRFVVLDYRVDSGTLAYLVAISLAAAILSSLPPIGTVVQLGLNGALNGDTRGSTRSLGTKRLASTFVVGQMTLALVLLSGAGILVRSFMNVVGADSGVREPERILVGALKLPSDRYPTPTSRLKYFDRLETQLGSIPGIEQAAVASAIPVNGVFLRRFEIEGRPPSPEGAESVGVLTVGSNYFRVLGGSAIVGREFNDGDWAATVPVAIVNQSFVTRFWPGADPVGKRLRLTDQNQEAEWRGVVGVVPNIMQGDPTRQTFRPLIYLPFRQELTTRGVNSDGVAFNGANFLVRAGVGPDLVAPVVSAEVQNLDTDAILEEFSTLKASFAFHRDRMDLAHGEMDKQATVAPVFAVMATLLAAIGLYAVVAHTVMQRMKEIGIRIAIGASANDIGRMVLRDGMSPVAIGMVLGLSGSVAVNRVLQSQLVGVSPNDPLTMSAATVVLVVIALLACRIPVRRAMRVDPVVVLRAE